MEIKAYQLNLPENQTATGLRTKPTCCDEFLSHLLRAHSYPQLYHRSPAATLILRRLGYRLHVRMLLQRLPQGFAQDAHAAAMDHTDSRQAGEEGVVDKFFYGARRVVDVEADDIDLRGCVLAFVFE